MLAAIKGLHKNIRGILVPRDMSHRQFALSNNISNEMMTHVEVFRAGMKNWIFDGFEGTFRVRVDHEDGGSSRRFLIPKYV